MSLADQFIKSSSKMKGAGRLSDVVKEEKILYNTGIYALNLAYSGDLHGGIPDGIHCLAGKSRSFKSMFGLLSCKAYLDTHEDAYMIFYDSEGGAAEDYFESVGIDPSRVIYIPIMNIEDLKFDMMEKLEAIRKQYKETGEYSHFVFFTDSIGNLASVKEVNDAIDQKSVADMSRAKALKSLFRIVTPYFTNYKMYWIPIMHTYDEIGGMGAPKQIMSGGQGGMLSANSVFIIGKRQVKDGKDLLGWNFVMNAEKSRTIREKSSIPIEVLYEGGIDRYTGLLDIALATGYVTKPKMGWYTRPNIEGDKNWRKKETSCPEFWDKLLNDEKFCEAVKNMYKLSGGGQVLQDKLETILTEGEDFNPETGEIYN